ncbi:MAG TPA: DUF3180 domain-containing protein [Plantibacter sp.]|uniref:DUF3180 domain-containing protein n=1 Tax=unclassified Plantibacter TaxID=2624265 RepID=UPI002B516984|nr:DUF3180 domain-containing protein [Plantibacter sp.]
MKRTSATPLIVLAAVGVVFGYLLEVATVSAGRASIIPPVTLAVFLVAIAIVLVALSWPIRRSTTGRATRRIDPFRAMRVAALAKASSHAGSLVAGAAIGILLFLLTRPIVPALGSFWLVIASIVGSVALVVAALVAEWFCTVPKDEDDDAAPGGAPSHT